MLRAGELLYYREGAASTVSVRRIAGATTLAIDGKVDASNAGDMLTQRLLAHVPLLLHPDPHDVAIIGLGSGVTLGSAASPSGFARSTRLKSRRRSSKRPATSTLENGHALDPTPAPGVDSWRWSHSPDVRRGAPAGYDVIVSEPSNPWIAGCRRASRPGEFFGIVRARLAPGGDCRVSGPMSMT